MNKIKLDKTKNFIHHIIEKDLASGRVKKVFTRFPPEPNGYLHIGHAKSICLNFGIAEYYQGKCNLRFDDTNPKKEKIQYVHSIIRDIKWLGFKWSGKIKFSSDYFDIMYQFAVELIKKGLSYVDCLSYESIQKYRGTLKNPGKNSPYRDQTVEENLSLFLNMKNGKFPEGGACLRAKIDMSSPVLIMRDPILYRIRYLKHHQTDDKWCIYPTYDFAQCISDSIEGITHSLCTLEFQENKKLYDWILSNISIKSHPHQYEFSRLNIENLITSKRKLQYLVKNKIVDGWDDPRMPTISGLRRRGYTAKSIREFCKRIGITRKDSNIKFSILEDCIRSELERNAPRIMGVICPIKLIISSLPIGYEQEISVPNHPKRPDMGSRTVVFSREIYIDSSDFREKEEKNYNRLILGKEVKLRYSYIIRAEKIEKNSKNEIITIFCKHDPNSLHKKFLNKKKIKGVIHWVSVSKSIRSEFRLYKNLFIGKIPEKEEDLSFFYNPNSLEIKYGFVEPSILLRKVKCSFQFEREGFFYFEKYHPIYKHPIFNLTAIIKNHRDRKIQG